MRDQHVGCVLVVEEADPGRVVVGILTDRDIVTAAVAKELDIRLIAVGEIMGIRRIPVTGLQGVLIGLVTLDDLLEVLADEMQTMAAAIGRKRESGAST